jgi:hypothetical protein
MRGYISSGMSRFPQPTVGNSQAVTGGSGILTGAKMRLLLYQPKTPFDTADIVILDEQLDGDKIFANMPLLFTVDKPGQRYMTPIILEVELTSGATSPAFPGDAMLALRFRRGY